MEATKKQKELYDALTTLVFFPALAFMFLTSHRWLIAAGIVLGSLLITASSPRLRAYLKAYPLAIALYLAEWVGIAAAYWSFVRHWISPHVAFGVMTPLIMGFGAFVYVTEKAFKQQAPGVERQSSPEAD